MIVPCGNASPALSLLLAGTIYRSRTCFASAIATAVRIAGCNGDTTYNPPSNVKPAFLGAVTKNSYDGNTDDLLTAGLGKTGLGGAAAPPPANPTAPTAAELRRIAIFNN